ncbi:hypothetical protein AVEN_52981-2-1, partial [Araneus ventricosus]
SSAAVRNHTFSHFHSSCLPILSKMVFGVEKGEVPCLKLKILNGGKRNGHF